MEALVGQEAQFVSNPVRKAEPVKSVTHGCSHRCTGRQLKDKPNITHFIVIYVITASKMHLCFQGYLLLLFILFIIRLFFVNK